MRRQWAMLAITVMAAGACSGSHAAASSTPPTTAAVAPAGPDAPAPSSQPTLRAAVTALLSAEQRGDHAASFVLLTDESRATYGTIDRWKSRRAEMPVVTDFKITNRGSDANSVDLVVDHPAGLDPFRGLSPAQDHEIWTGRHEHGGWLVDADPVATPVLPADRGVAPTVIQWVKAAESCDQAAIHHLQAVDPLLGIGDAGTQLCRQKFAFTFSAPSTVPPGDMTQQLVAQYSADALGWARMVTLTGAPAPIEVLVAPIGNGWRVIGAYA
jgi:hypothetical protein